jgi:hypothetical protein
MDDLRASLGGGPVTDVEREEVLADLARCEQAALSLG